MFKLYIALNYFTITTANAYYTLHKLGTVLSDVRDFIALNILIVIYSSKICLKFLKGTFIEKNILQKGNVSCNF